MINRDEEPAGFASDSGRLIYLIHTWKCGCEYGGDYKSIAGASLQAGGHLLGLRYAVAPPSCRSAAGEMIETLLAAVSQSGCSYLTARLEDLISGALKPPRSRSELLTKEELQSSQNYRFYCRFWRSLTETFREVQFVRSAGLYRGVSDWLKRWPAEKSRYSSLILITFLSSPRSTAQTVVEYPGCPGIDLDNEGYRYVGAGVAREVVDIVALGRPVCLIEADDSASTYRIVDRFTLMPVLRPTKNCTAIAGEDSDASPYAPDCSAVEAVLRVLKT